MPVLPKVSTMKSCVADPWNAAQQVVQVAQGHAGGILRSQPLGQIGERLHRADRMDAAFSALFRISIRAG